MGCTWFYGSQNYRLYENVYNAAKMKTLSDRNTTQTDIRIFGIEKDINKYSNTFKHLKIFKNYYWPFKPLHYNNITTYVVEMSRFQCSLYQKYFNLSL